MPDSSEKICKGFADKYENVVLYSEENEGLSKTRNYALMRANGKYIFFLDSDDRLRPDTVKSVTDFFDTVYDEVDLVTYKIIQYFNGVPVITHYRYRTLLKTGVYDLLDPENRFITQTNVNICIKNRGADNFIQRFSLYYAVFVESLSVFNRIKVNSLVCRSDDCMRGKNLTHFPFFVLVSGC